MAKKRVSLTLDEDLIEKIDEETNRRDLNRSEFVGGLAEEYFESRKVETAVVLCGDPEKKTLEKCNGEPVLKHVLKNLSRKGIKKTVLLIGDNDEIKDLIGNEFDGMDIDYMEECQVKGTATALKKAEDVFETDFFVVNGHVITDVDLDEMARKHRESEYMVTMALTTVQNPSDYGVADMKGDKILGFEEKPEKGEEPSRLVNAGTYVTGPGIFEEIEGEEDLEQVFGKLSDRDQLGGYIYGGKWKHVSKN